MASASTEKPLGSTPVGTPDSLYRLVSLLFPPDADSVYLSPAPLYHAAPLRYCLTMQRSARRWWCWRSSNPSRRSPRSRPGPRSVDFRADLPRHPTGKLLKRVLRDEYAQLQEVPR
ncbi:MAG: AMP-dependent synthetase and ligase [Streptosporangiaceae bacterium]|nr:AMP-dependent synthetase and ligase [Streptosporangiaceae bacterium]